MLSRCQATVLSFPKSMSIPYRTKMQEQDRISRNRLFSTQGSPCMPADLRPRPKNYFYGLRLVLKISSWYFYSIKSFNFLIQRGRCHPTEMSEIVGYFLDTAFTFLILLVTDEFHRNWLIARDRYRKVKYLTAQD